MIMDADAARIIDMIFGRWRSQTLLAGAELGVFDHLGSDAPLACDVLAARLAVDPTLLYRLLRALASLGVLAEDKARRFSLLPAGALLRADHPSSLKPMLLLEEGPEHYALWTHLPAMVREGSQNAFTREFGMMAFDYARGNNRYGRVFNQAMTSYSATQSEWALEALKDFDFSLIRSLCDVAGGHGHLNCAFLKTYGGLSGIVLDLPEVVAQSDELWAPKLGLTDRCRYVGGDMFKQVPAADAYSLKLILHDWNDRECVQILSNLRQSASGKGYVFIIEHIVPGPDQPHFAKLFDIHMMCWGTGRERTEDEYARLLTEAGWRYAGTRYPKSGMMGVVIGAGD
jgi:O-methyltransferase domain/Dimerisation domain